MKAAFTGTGEGGNGRGRGRGRVSGTGTGAGTDVHGRGDRTFVRGARTFPYPVTIPIPIPAVLRERARARVRVREGAATVCFTFALLLAVLGFLAFLPLPVTAQAVGIASPDGRTQVVVRVGEGTTWEVGHGGRVILAASPVSMTLGDGRVLGRGAKVERVARRAVDSTIVAIVPVKNARVRDRFNEAAIAMRGGYGLVVRAYDDGVAYRWTTRFPDSITVRSEEATFRFDAPHAVILPNDTSFFSHQEAAYVRVPMDSIAAGRKGLVPLLVDIAGGPKIVITESSLESYAGMRIAGTGGAAVVGAFPPYALADSALNDRDVPVTRPADYIARTAGTRAFPWRIVAIADRDADLLENEIVYRLSPPSRLDDIAWIRPGLVAWDWWNALNIHGVDFRAGINTPTYRYYIDFAARHGIPYIILDEGWSPTEALTTVVPELDLPALVRYGDEKGVGIILWALWKPLDRRMDEVLDSWKGWGIRGIKVDFMQRDDQAMVDFYWRLARAAAERHLLVDYHGAYKPAGLERAYPNVLTREGVRGNEWNKWSQTITPEHELTLPFTRMFAGPMDFTPGAMRNASKDEHKAIFSRPMSQGTRAHQMAMYVVYESPLQMLSDNPTHYDAEPVVIDFLAKSPTTWDETRALDAAVGDYVLIARRKGAEWWIGAMTDATPRTLPLDLSFLGDGEWTAEIFRDGINADRYGEDFVREIVRVGGSSRLTVAMGAGGGWVARVGRGR